MGLNINHTATQQHTVAAEFTAVICGLFWKISFPRRKCAFSKLLWKDLSLRKNWKICLKALILSYKRKLRNNNKNLTKVRIVDT